MFYLTIAVTVAIITTLLNLLLTFGVIRKLRVHDAKLAAGAHTVHQDATLAAGSPVAPVTAVTVDGRPTAAVRPGSAHLVGFFSVGCAACDERIPEFLGYRERTGVPALAVVVTDAGDSSPYVTRLSGHDDVDVVVENEGGPLATAFAVTSFPALCLLDRDGVVLAGGNDFRQLPDFVPA